MPKVDLDRMKRFCEVLAQTLLASPDDPDRTELLNAIASARSMRQARMLVRDFLEWSQDIRGEQLSDLDGSLGAAGLPTLSLMRAKEDAALARILVRGRILTEEEFQLVNARVADTASTLEPGDRRLAEHLVSAFRARA
jgi:hypothetical protein